tara:strand:- start:3100 stop:4299 length:1200 start_codon:yes stop_codon:yes gene_type:complete
MKINNYSKVLTYLIILSVIYCVFMVTYSFSKSDNSTILNSYIDIVKVQDENIASLYKQISNLGIEKKMISAIEKVSKSVVSIYVISKNQMLSEETIELANKNSGSGVIIDEQGYVVTNYHVIKSAISDDNEVVIRLFGGEQFTIGSDKISFDALTDLAILKIDGYNFTPPLRGDSDKVKVGSIAIALGNPLGLFDMSFEPTATTGIISGKNIDFGLDEDFGSVYKDMIQTDASINPGNSGGPLLDKEGKIIGINTFIITGSEDYKGSVGLNFAIPINRAIKIINELKENGEIDRKHITGIELADIDLVIKKIWKSYLEGIDEGVIVLDVEKKSAGEKAGLKIRDVILEVNGRKINSVKDYNNAILEDEMKTGEYIELLILRNNESKVINLELEKRKFHD